MGRSCPECGCYNSEKRDYCMNCSHNLDKNQSDLRQFSAGVEQKEGRV